MNPDIDADARELISLRQGRGATQSSLAVATLHDAYQVQARVLHRLQESIGGWKIAVSPEGIPVAAPLFASTILASGSVVTPTVGMKIETELAFKLKRELPARQTPYTRREVIDAISTVQCAFEIIQARRAGDNVAFEQMLADNLANGYTVLAAETAPVPDSFDDVEATIERDGIRIAFGRHPADDPLLAILEYANKPGDQLGGLRTGQVVITGSFTGAQPVANSQYVGAVGSLNSVVVRFR